MSIITKFLFSLFLVVLPLQKTKDKCLIIFLEDNDEMFKIGSIRNDKIHFYIYLKYPNPKENREYKNPMIEVMAPENPTGVSYNLQNREEIESLPDSIKPCDCSSLEDFNLGMDFKLYVENEDGWEVFDAKKLSVQE